jgi:hypothetical protein
VSTLLIAMPLSFRFSHLTDGFELNSFSAVSVGRREPYESLDQSADYMGYHPDFFSALLCELLKAPHNTVEPPFSASGEPTPTLERSYDRFVR